MTRPVIVRPEADRDATADRDWYERQRAGLGMIFAARVAAAIDKIGETPELYGEVAPGVRAAPVARHQHIIYYRVYQDRVEVLAILHGGRDPAEWQSRT